MVTACFKGFPACVALSRSAILDGVGGKTQVGSFLQVFRIIKNLNSINFCKKVFGLISSVLMLIVCLAVGPLFKTLPNVNNLWFDRITSLIF